MPEELRALMLRFTELGCLLPRGDDIAMDVALTDERTRASAELVLSEMRRVKAEIDGMLAAARAEAAQPPDARPHQ
jgi:hypothetical protein